MKEQLEKLWYQAESNKWFNPSITPSVLKKYTESESTDETLNKIYNDFFFIHNIIMETPNVKKTYWKEEEYSKPRGQYKKTGKISPLFNVDIITYGMWLCQYHPKGELKDKFSEFVGRFYYYKTQFDTNELQEPHLSALKEYILLSSKSTGTNLPKRKHYLDLIWNECN